MQIFYSILITFLMISCGEPRYEKFDNVENDGGLNPKDGDPKETMKMSSNRSNNQIGTGISFETVKKQILEKNCISCHPQYSDYTEVFNAKNSILDAVLSDRMPKNSAPLSADMKNLLKSWIDSGAPEKSLPPSGGENREDQDDDLKKPGDREEVILEAKWGSISKNIIFPKCAQCHNPNGEGSFLDLTNLDKIKEQKDYIIGDHNKPEDSLLYEVITDPFEPMPPPRSGLSKLTEAEVKVLADWIKADLPN